MNHLKGETSPYLLQHIDNPVDWHPWGDNAFNLAKTEDKPILLSVGYSACHWCHVMAHESFEDSSTAEFMNKHFINVKVDREERPDIDAIYMQALTSLTGSGGWPMTVFLTPDKDPFYAGTYFPKERRNSMPAFLEVLESIHKSWEQERAKTVASAEQITSALKAVQSYKQEASPLIEAGPKPANTAEGASAGFAQHQSALLALKASQDPAWGGFGNAPKFPQVMALEYLLLGSGDDDLAMLVKTSLDAMASGGIYDHLGGGFSRYSTDIFWLVPHFEKMLYDNALLIRLYLHGWLYTKKARYRQVVQECVEYICRDLYGSDSGGFFSAEDADSASAETGESKEGEFYVWKHSEFMSALESSANNNSGNNNSGKANLGDLAANWYGLSEAGNFEGRNILYRRQRGDLIRPPQIETARQILYAEREKRSRPLRDEKILTEWNGLAISALAEAGFYLNKNEWTDIAEKAGEFLWTNLRRKDGRWLRSFMGKKAGKADARHLACSSDYAQVLEAFIQLYFSSANSIWLQRAQETADNMLELFWDSSEGGFFTTGKDATDLIYRHKNISDHTLPSANSTAALALMRLSALTGIAKYEKYADEILDLCAELAYRHPLAFGNLLCALLIKEMGMVQIVIPGKNEEYLNQLRRHYVPNAVYAWGEKDSSPVWGNSLMWEGKQANCAYICRDFNCLEPATTQEKFGAQLAELSQELKSGLFQNMDATG